MQIEIYIPVTKRKQCGRERQSILRKCSTSTWVVAGDPARPRDRVIKSVTGEQLERVPSQKCIGAAMDRTWEDGGDPALSKSEPG